MGWRTRMNAKHHTHDLSIHKRDTILLRINAASILLLLTGILIAVVR